MGAFSYHALDANGRKKTGVLEADTERQVRQLLRDQGLLPVNVEVAEQTSSAATAAESGLVAGGHGARSAKSVPLTLL